MTVLPNSFERYTAALRNLTSILILRNGLNQKHLKNLSKIYTAEAFFYHHKQPLNIEKFACGLLGAASLIKPNKLVFSVNCRGNFLINKNLFTVLLLNLSKECSLIEIEIEGDIVISFTGKCKKALSALKNLRGFYFYSINTQRGKFIIPVLKINEKSIPFENEWENISYQFSPVNLFFGNIL